MSAKTPADDLIERLRATQLSICNDAADAMSAMDQQRRAFLGQIERLESQRGTLIGEGNCIDPVKWSPLGEIKARVAEERRRLTECWWLSDLEYALGEIERLAQTVNVYYLELRRVTGQYIIEP